MFELNVDGDLFAREATLLDAVREAVDAFDLEDYEEVALTEQGRIYIKAIAPFAPYTILEIEKYG
jgi:hypothetical protein